MRRARIIAWAVAIAVALGLSTTQVSTAHAKARDGALIGVVNINTASDAQLGMLPGIGPARAEAIINRRENKPFRRPDDLRRIKGIGAKTYARLKVFLVVEGATTLRRAETPAPDEEPSLTP